MAQGISFAIPVNTAKWVVSELLTHGKVRRAYLGLSAQMRPIARQAQVRYKLPMATVVEVVSLARNGPAQKAGLREGDIVIALNGKPISTVDDVHRSLSGMPPGTSVQLTILRDRENLEIKVLTDEM
jgi:S1-C subfamily serine protease